MRQLLPRLAAGLFAFILGISLAAVWANVRRPRNSATLTFSKVVGDKAESVFTNPRKPAAEWDAPSLSPEDKAVVLAEEFVARNGYTKSPAVLDGLAYESVEDHESTEAMLKSRHDTLEREAYGVSAFGRGGMKDGWTVVFRYSGRVRLGGGTTGRAVTMDKNFGDLRVEHKDFFLGKVEKGLQASR